jgi:thioredoxin reductase/NAD-dependent dihydropyrimidine dehydrogenase PreA subunit
MMPQATSLFASSALATTVLGGALVLARRTHRKRLAARIQALRTETGKHIPRSLHPVINPDICIGSGSCLNSCPEGDILAMVGHAAQLVRSDHCIGHGRCEAECPVQAIKLVFGTAERGIDLPQVDGYFESSRAGVHLVGELGGMGLIKNAMRQGLQVGNRLAEVTPAGGVVVVVGAGPAGLATAMALKARGVAHRLIEQGSVGGAVYHYPRHKITMTEPIELPQVGSFGKTRITKEELLEGWHRIIGQVGLTVEEGTRLTGLEGTDGDFQVLTSAGPIAAAKLVLAIGRRGTPRALGVPGEALEKVVYGLTDPEQYQGSRVLVVGGGDAAVEAAAQLATDSDAEVTISYRSAEFGSCREANRTRIAELVATGRVRTLLPSTVLAIEPGAVQLEVGGAPLRIENDFVIVNIGGELPAAFLATLGISMRRFHGEVPGTFTPVPGTLAAVKALPPPRSAADEADRRRFLRMRVLYVMLGAAVLAWLASKGWDYYPLSRLARRHSPLHLTMRPAGSWGHGVGIVASAVLLSNFMLAVRKRARALNGRGDIRGWLDFHVFVGFMSPLVIAFHAAFQMNNHLSDWTWVALAVVVGTGVVGRFVYSLVPAHAGDRYDEMEALSADFERQRAYAAPELEHTPGGKALLRRATAPVTSGSLLALFGRLPFEMLWLRARLWSLRRRLEDPTHYPELRRALIRLVKLRWQVRFYKSLKRLLRGWRLFHVTLAVCLVVLLTAHVGVALYLGYGLE